MTKAAESQNKDHRDTDERDDGREGHVLLGFGHLVRFEERDAGQAEFDFGMRRFAFRDDLTQTFQ